MILRVISGYQSGADIAGIRAAHQCGLPTGGWIPKGWLTEHGPRPEYAGMYGAVEHGSEKYPPRTYANVKDSDATILFVSTRARTERGCDLTREACKKLGKPMLEIRVWGQPDSVPPTAKLAGLIGARGFKVVNIAGSRGSSDPPIDGRPGSGIEYWVESYLIDVFTLLKGHP